jgi:hypothetical protein
VRGGRTHGTAQVWGEWASARMLRVLVREGARVHAAAGVRTVAPPVFFSARGWQDDGVQKARSRAFLHSSARFRALPHPDKAETVSARICFLMYLFLGQEPKADISFEGEP